MRPQRYYLPEEKLLFNEYMEGFGAQLGQELMNLIWGPDWQGPPWGPQVYVALQELDKLAGRS